MHFKPRATILAPWLHSQDLCMVFASRGIGKTHFCLAAAFAIATGGAFAKWTAPRPHKVLYLDGELPGALMQKRLLMHCPDVEPAPEYLRIFTPDLLPDGELMPDLSTAEGQQTIEAMIEPDTEVLFIDNLSAWARTGRENEGESWQPVGEWLLTLRRRGIAPPGVWVYVGTPPKWVAESPDVIVVCSNPRAIDWRPVVGLHVDVVEVGDQGALFFQTVNAAEAGKPRSIGVACRAGVAGLNEAHEQLLKKLQRQLNAFPV